MPAYRITVRWGGGRIHRYHTLEVDAPDVAEALRRTADGLPDHVRADADLVELRVAVDPDERPWLG